jgi:hypothetical protein
MYAVLAGSKMIHFVPTKMPIRGEGSLLLYEYVPLCSFREAGFVCMLQANIVRGLVGISTTSTTVCEEKRYRIAHLISDEEHPSSSI